MMRFKLTMCASIFCWALNAEAKDLGRHGEVWAINEKDAMVEIKDRLSAMEKNGELEKHNAKLLEKAKKRLRRPNPVEHVKHSTTARDFTYDPSYSYPSNLKNHRGEVFYKAGSTVNPLDYVSMPYNLVFLDGDDKKQREWAIKLHEQSEIKPLLILVKGEPLTLSEQYNIHFYFDQFGYTSKKLGIEQVPALVNQQGKHLRIREIVLKEGKI